MIRALSTKILSPKHKEYVASHGIDLSDYNAIEISFRKFAIDLSFDNYIFTSQNAVRGFLRAFDNLPLPEKRKEALAKPCFCVGQKTAGLLKENSLNVLKIAKNSQELAVFISKKHKNESFLFICGNRRRADLPRILKENGVRFEETIAYHTLNNPKKLENSFEAVLFYSPSGVQSYSSMNDMSHSTAFCIGESTAREAAKFAAQVIISEKQSIESVLHTMINHYIPNST